MVRYVICCLPSINTSFREDWLISCLDGRENVPLEMVIGDCEYVVAVLPNIHLLILCFKCFSQLLNLKLETKT